MEPYDPSSIIIYTTPGRTNFLAVTADIISVLSKQSWAWQAIRDQENWRGKSLKKVKFCFGIHNHQPVGNFGWVIEDAYQKSYLPFLQLLERFPRIRIALHFTGILYDWIEQFHPECFDLIRAMNDRGQLELLTGGFYEPILPVIPDRDKVGQILQQSDFVEREFGARPTGMWLAERVWEPSLPKHLSAAGVKYTILDDIHFRYAGLEESKLDGYYVTEDQGYQISLFPIAKRLRYTIPFADPEETIAYLRSLATETGESIAVYADDGEKFGVWPKTHQHCFVDGWLERFLQMLCDNLDWIEMITFSEALETVPARGRVYLPTASYSEMNEWAMPVAAIERYEDFVHKLKDIGLYEPFESFVKGGFWRNFQTKYDESNYLHKRMLLVSDLLETHREALQPADYEQAKRLLYAGQCNCPYWHGVFGGLYLPHLRGAVYQELVAAEAHINACISASRDLQVEQRDYDCDGRGEIIITTPFLKTIIAPHLGGMITEFDHFGIAKNLIDIVGRRKEGYHNKLLHRNESTGAEAKSIHDLVMVKEAGLENLLVEDKYRRGMFIDHFLPDSLRFEDFESGNFSSTAGPTQQPYIVSSNTSDATTEVTLARNEQVDAPHGATNIDLTKIFRFAKGLDGFEVRYALRNHGSKAVAFNFGCEVGLGSFPFPNSEAFLIGKAGEYMDLKNRNTLSDCRQLAIYSRLYRFLVEITTENSASAWTHPLWTVSLSEGGFEKVMQGTIILLRWQITLAPGQTWKTTISLRNRVDILEPALSSR